LIGLVGRHQRSCCCPRHSFFARQRAVRFVWCWFTFHHSVGQWSFKNEADAIRMVDSCFVETAESQAMQLPCPTKSHHKHSLLFRYLCGRLLVGNHCNFKPKPRRVDPGTFIWTLLDSRLGRCDTFTILENRGDPFSRSDTGVVVKPLLV